VALNQAVRHFVEACLWNPQGLASGSAAWRPPFQKRLPIAALSSFQNGTLRAISDAACAIHV